MPLTPSDAAYLNHLLDRHLKNQRSWPWMRYFMLAMSAFMIAMAISAAFIAKSTAHLTDLEADLETLAPRSAAAATRPVTHAELLAVRDTMQLQTTMVTWLAMLGAGSAMAALFFFFLGMDLAATTLAKWNHHRRDAILITLLREKCAPELAPPPAPPKSEI